MLPDGWYGPMQLIHQLDIGACIFKRRIGPDPSDILIPQLCRPGGLRALPSCMRGYWRRGTSLGSITITFLMPYSRTPHLQVVVEALAAFRRQDLHRIGRSRLGGAARGKFEFCRIRSPSRAAPPSASSGSGLDAVIRKAARASTTTCGLWTWCATVRHQKRYCYGP